MANKPLHLPAAGEIKKKRMVPTKERKEKCQCHAARDTSTKPFSGSKMTTPDDDEACAHIWHRWLEKSDKNESQEEENKRRSEDICEGRRASPFFPSQPVSRRQRRFFSDIFLFSPYQKINRNFIYFSVWFDWKSRRNADSCDFFRCQKKKRGNPQNGQMRQEPKKESPQ